MSDLPPEIDPAFYRAQNPDLAALDDAQIIDHFRRWGADEGRLASPFATRAAFLADVNARENGRLLEVGPGCAPSMTGAKVRYLDAFPADQLSRHGGSPAPHIHYVGTIDALPRSFDAAVACRSIGHHPDLIGHLQDIGRVLIEGGRYYLIVPDARYTAWTHVPRATVAAAIDAHRSQRRTHSLASLIAARELRLDNDIAARWAGATDLPSATLRARRIKAALEEYDDATAYCDVEAWHFTPGSFRDLLTMLHELGLSPFVPSRVWTPPAGSDEFCAMLVKA